MQRVQMIHFRQYSNAQRIAFAGLVIAFILCISGCFLPNWITAKVKQTITLVELNAGLWTYCVKVIGMDEKCFSTGNKWNSGSDSTEDFSDDNSESWINTAKTLSLACVIGCLASGIAACLRTCCCPGGKTICHGVTAFIAGVAGIGAVLVFTQKTKIMLNLPLTDVSYDYGLYLFGSGAAIAVFSAFILCFSVPLPDYNGMVMNPGTTGPNIVVQTSQSQQMGGIQMANPATGPMGGPPPVAGYNYNQQPIRQFDELPAPTGVQNTY